VASLKTLTVNGVTYKVASPVPVLNITLTASAWSGSNNRYSQVVTVPGVTSKSQVNLAPSVEQVTSFYEKDISFHTKNAGGKVTVYVIGQKPDSDYTFQVKLVEVATDSSEIYGTLVTTPIAPEKIAPNGIVKTINGVAPDENGNVVIEGGGVVDTNEIVNEVLAALPTAEGVSY
jgi:hypothetical protein